MANITLTASYTCSQSGGVITGNWGGLSTQNATVTLLGTATSYTDSKSFAAVASGSFTFSNLPNDLYEVQVTGSTDGVSNLVELNVNCTPSGGPACDVVITGVSVNADTAMVNAVGTGALEYSLNYQAFQSSNVFTVPFGNHSVTVRKVADVDCEAYVNFTVAEPESIAVTGPTRDWLPVGLPILYTFTSPAADPGILEVEIQVSSNGADFNNPIIAGIIVLPPDSNKQYAVNIAPYLEAVFAPAPPVLSGVDNNLFKLYRLKVGALITPQAHALYATVLTPVINGMITLSNEPNGYKSTSFAGIKTEVNVPGNMVWNASANYDGTAPLCPKHPIQLYWLNRKGGWQTWVFDGKHEYGQEIEDPVTWQDEFNRTHRASLPAITETVSVFSGFIPLTAYDTVFSILASIRVYAREAGIWREVNIEPGSYQRHKAGQRRKELNFRFTWSQELQVQTA